MDLLNEALTTLPILMSLNYSKTVREIILILDINLEK